MLLVQSHDRDTELNYKVMFRVLYDLLKKTEDIRRFAALDLAYIAANQYHFFVKGVPWIFAAGILIVEEAAVL